MAQIDIYVDAGTVVRTHEGAPPVDQTALVASLVLRVDVLTGERDAAAATLAAVTVERNDAVSALAALQVKFDALNAAIDAAQGQA